MKYSYLNGNGINAVFIAGTVVSRLGTSISTQNRKASGTELTHRRTEIKVSRPSNIVRDGTVKGTEPLSVSIVLSGSTDSIAQDQLALMLQDSMAFVNDHWNEIRVVGISPRVTDVIVSETRTIGL